MKGIANKPEDVFLDAIRDEQTGCLIWQGARGGSKKTPYGVFRLWGRNIGAHIAAYIATHGPKRKGYEIGHTANCFTGGLCIEPTHLVEQTHTENMAQRFGSMELCVKGLHPWIEENIYTRKDNGRRMCRGCMKLAATKHNRKKQSQHL
jgi:hypothetical protein